MSVRRCKVYLFDEEEDSEGVERKNPEVIFEQNKNVKRKGKTIPHREAVEVGFIGFGESEKPKR